MSCVQDGVVYTLSLFSSATAGALAVFYVGKKLTIQVPPSAFGTVPWLRLNGATDISQVLEPTTSNLPLPFGYIIKSAEASDLEFGTCVQSTLKELENLVSQVFAPACYGRS